MSNELEVSFSITSQTESTSRRWLKISRNEIGAPSVQDVFIEESETIAIRRSAVEWNSQTFSLRDGELEDKRNRHLFIDIANKSGASGKEGFSKRIKLQRYFQHPVLLVLGQKLFAFGCVEETDKVDLQIHSIDTTNDGELRWHKMVGKGRPKVGPKCIEAYSVDYDTMGNAIFWFKNYIEENLVISPWRYNCVEDMFEVVKSFLPTDKIPASFSNVQMQNYMFMYLEDEIVGFPLIEVDGQRHHVLRFPLPGPWQGRINLVRVGAGRLVFVAMDQDHLIWCQYVTLEEDSGGRQLQNDGCLCFPCASDYLIETVFLTMPEIASVPPQPVVLATPTVVLDFQAELEKKTYKFICEGYLIHSTGSDAWMESNGPIPLFGYRSLVSLFEASIEDIFWTDDPNGSRLSTFLKNLLREILKGLRCLSQLRQTTIELSGRLIFFHESDVEYHYPKILVKKGPLKTTKDAERINYREIEPFLEEIQGRYNVVPHPEIEAFNTYLREGSRDWYDICEHPITWFPGEGVQYFSEVSKMDGETQFSIPDFKTSYGKWTRKGIGELPYIHQRIVFQQDKKSRYTNTAQSLVTCVRDARSHAGSTDRVMQEGLETKVPTIISDVYQRKGRQGRMRYLESNVPN